MKPLIIPTDEENPPTTYNVDEDRNADFHRRISKNLSSEVDLTPIYNSEAKRKESI